MSKYILSIDLGGTKTAAALFDENGKLVNDYVYTIASRTFEGELSVYKNTINAGLHVLEYLSVSQNDLEGIGIGCPGPLDTRTGVIINAPLMRWKNFPLQERVEEEFGLPVKVNNDCILGALAEQRCGEAKGEKNVIYVTVSTGIGSGMICNGQIYEGHSGGSGELGHISIKRNGRKCACGNRGCLELYCSGTAIKTQMQRDFKRGLSSQAFEICGSELSKLDARGLSEAAKCGDPYALELFGKVGRDLGFGLVSIVNLMEPDMIVLGGSVCKAREYFHEEMIKVIRERAINKLPEKRIVYSRLGDKVVLYGAYFLIRDYLDVR